MKSETGTYNWIEQKQALKNIELFTERFKRNKISTEDYIKNIHLNLLKLSNKRDYYGYLESIGQL